MIKLKVSQKVDQKDKDMNNRRAKTGKLGAWSWRSNIRLIQAPEKEIWKIWKEDIKFPLTESLDSLNGKGPPSTSEQKLYQVIVCPLPEPKNHPGTDPLRRTKRQWYVQEIYWGKLLWKIKGEKVGVGKESLRLQCRSDTCERRGERIQ